MLVVNDLTREFTTAEETVTAVDSVAFELDHGVFAAVIGKSGSGKSTLLSLLGTLDIPTTGSIELDGVEVTQMRESELTAYRRDSIGFVFQSYNLIPNLSALDNVALPMEFAGVPKGERFERAAHLLEQVGLTADKQRRRPGHLSGGEQQRVAIARALANRPKLVLADEPTGNLDSETGEMIVRLLRDLAKCEDVTIIAVTHDSELAALADRTFQLKDGRITESVFPRAVAHANEAFDVWREHREDAEAAAAFVSAIEALIEAAPKGRKLSAEKIRARYTDAVGLTGFDAALGRLAAHDDLLESD